MPSQTCVPLGVHVTEISTFSRKHKPPQTEICSSHWPLCSRRAQREVLREPALRCGDEPSGPRASHMQKVTEPRPLGLSAMVMPATCNIKWEFTFQDRRKKTLRATFKRIIVPSPNFVQNPNTLSQRVCGAVRESPDHLTPQAVQRGSG